jgi:hypothetical protein
MEGAAPLTIFVAFVFLLEFKELEVLGDPEL